MAKAPPIEWQLSSHKQRSIERQLSTGAKLTPELRCRKSVIAMSLLVQASLRSFRAKTLQN